MTISCWSSKASCRLSSFGWCSWFMMLISLLTVFLSSGYGVLMNLATKFRPVDFSTARWTTPKAPLHVQSQHTDLYSPWNAIGSIFKIYRKNVIILLIITTQQCYVVLVNICSSFGSFTSVWETILHYTIKRRKRTKKETQKSTTLRGRPTNLEFRYQWTVFRLSQPRLGLAIGRMLKSQSYVTPLWPLYSSLSRRTCSYFNHWTKKNSLILTVRL